jgi:hypothetical protein
MSKQLEADKPADDITQSTCRNQSGCERVYYYNSTTGESSHNGGYCPIEDFKRLRQEAEMNAKKIKPYK